MATKVFTSQLNKAVHALRRDNIGDAIVALQRANALARELGGSSSSPVPMGEVEGGVRSEYGTVKGKGCETSSSKTQTAIRSPSRGVVDEVGVRPAPPLAHSTDNMAAALPVTPAAMKELGQSADSELTTPELDAQCDYYEACALWVQLE